MDKQNHSDIAAFPNCSTAWSNSSKSRLPTSRTSALDAFALALPTSVFILYRLTNCSEHCATLIQRGCRLVPGLPGAVKAVGAPSRPRQRLPDPPATGFQQLAHGRLDRLPTGER